MTLREATEILRRAEIENPAGDAGILLSEICGVSRASLPYSADIEYSDAEFEIAVNRRATREPLQYILGRWWFRDSEFFVSPDCLIPRPETEMLVELAVEMIPDGGKVLDLCTGSGCVGLSVLKERPDVTGVLVDISDKAMAMAEKNREKLGVVGKCRTLLADVTKPVPEELSHERFDVILANPPYITADEMNTLEPELSFEPRIALTDEGDGMSVVRGILRNYPALLKENGILAIEIGWGEGNSAIAECKNLGLSCEVRKDLSGNDRVLVCRI
ncbi:MAG: peptide chain release factor N(5)-glutamine methyltransferase [Ruminococcaceae bacterium]|nr:peptide chain release factor N(5)-glutamine methyltransferase [Oscillospiraceae bacterium]